MIAAATLSLFLLAALALFLSPGPNMAFVLSHGVAHGPRGGFAAAVGISAADLVHTLAAASGVTALIAAWPPSFDLLRYAGALYLLWLAWQALRSGSGGGLPANARARPAGFGRIVRTAFLNNLVNPKALLFFMVFLPQFVDAARGSVPLQLVQLGVMLSAAALVFNTLLGACSGQAGRWLQRRTGAGGKFQRALLALVMLGLAARLLLLERPAALSLPVLPRGT